MPVKKMYGLVHCHYDKRSKGIISAIGSLEKPLILPTSSHSISMIKARLGILLGIILFVSLFHACHPRLRSKVNIRPFILLAIISPTSANTFTPKCVYIVYRGYKTLCQNKRYVPYPKGVMLAP